MKYSINTVYYKLHLKVCMHENCTLRNTQIKKTTYLNIYSNALLIWSSFVNTEAQLQLLFDYNLLPFDYRHLLFAN